MTDGFAAISDSGVKTARLETPGESVGGEGPRAALYFASAFSPALVFSFQISPGMEAAKG